MLDNIVLFTILAENKSFTKTAELVSLSQSTLSKRIAEVENYFGTTLIIHSTRKFELTTDGEIIYHRFKHLRKYLTNSSSFLKKQDHDLSGELRVSLASVFSYELICPYIDEFIQKYPSIKLSLIFQQDEPDLINDSINVAISRYPFENENFDCSFLRHEIGQLFCTPQYVERFGKPRVIEELKEHRFIGIIDPYTKESVRILKLTNRYSKTEHIIGNLDIMLKTNLASHMKQIGMRNDYIFGCWFCLCEEELHSGELIPVLPDYEMYNMNFYLHSPKKPSLPEACFIDFIYRCINRSDGIDNLFKYSD